MPRESRGGQGRLPGEGLSHTRAASKGADQQPGKYVGVTDMLGWGAELGCQLGLTMASFPGHTNKWRCSLGGDESKGV